MQGPGGASGLDGSGRGREGTPTLFQLRQAHRTIDRARPHTHAVGRVYHDQAGASQAKFHAVLCCYLVRSPPRFTSRQVWCKRSLTKPNQALNSCISFKVACATVYSDSFSIIAASAAS
jgi:hypothetical protein